MTAAEDRVLIVGAGLAGLFLALKLAPRPALLLSPAPLGEAAASAWAQGGMAVALAADDAPAAHAADTIAAGAGLVDPVIAKLVTEEGPARVLDLLALGVPFDKTDDGALRQSLEAAHSRPRVVRVGGDLAGKAIMAALIAAARMAAHITIREGARAVALLRDENGAVRGVLLSSGETIAARETVLATGGLGGLYSVTTNPIEARGEGLAMAYRAGALIADAELVQFHPTAIDIGADPAPLATEALRGEGAALINAAGEVFVDALAPRDVVARAIHRERASGRGAFLDARAVLGERFPEHFPTVFAACMGAGLDPRRTPIPLAPAAHYHMGGVVSDLWGAASLDGLSVVGECASTGVHGANRLASNSLLEAVVFAHRIAERLRTTTNNPAKAALVPEAPPPILPMQDRPFWRALMQREANVERTGAGLRRALAELDAPARGNAAATNEGATMRLILEGALAREESRGAHARTDFPHLAAPLRTFRSHAPQG